MANRIRVVLNSVMDGDSTKETMDKLTEEFGSGYGDASNLNLVRQTRKIVNELANMGEIKLDGKKR